MKTRFLKTFFRNFWNFVTINLVYMLLSVLVVTRGLASVGLTNVTRSIARGRHSFGLSDFFETIRKNWKQALGAGVINILVYAILFLDIYFFFSGKGLIFAIGLGIAACFLVIFTVMNYYVWSLMITFRLPLKKIYKNSFRFVFINLKYNAICFGLLLLVYALYIGIALLFIFLFPKCSFSVVLLEILFYMVTFPAFKFLLVQYCVFPAIRRYIIDPYYREHPDEDVEMRSKLGLDDTE